MIYDYTTSNFAKICLKLCYLLYNSTILDNSCAGPGVDAALALADYNLGEAEMKDIAGYFKGK